MPDHDPSRPSLSLGERSELILAEARARDRAGVAVIATDSRGKIVYWSSGAESLYGWPVDEAIGRDILEVTPTRSSEDEATEIMEQLRNGRLWTEIFIVQRHDGTPIMVHVTDIPIRIDGEVIGVVGVSRPDT